MRTRVYIDGFNLYYRCLKRTPYKWLNLRDLSEKLLGEGCQIEAIKYFTADVSPRSGDTDAPRRQQAYLRALRTIPEVRIFKGRFMPKKKERPLVADPEKYVEIHDTEEKGSDVNLASHLLMDAFMDSYQRALVISQDTDLLEPLRMASAELGKEIFLGWSEQSSPSKKHKKIVHEIIRLRSSALRDSQFENPVIGRGGAKIEKPDSW